MKKYTTTENVRLLQRGVALLLVIIIALSILPGAAFSVTAEENDGTTPTTAETSPTDATQPEDTTPTTESTLPQEPDGNTIPADDPDNGIPPADDQDDGTPPADDQSNLTPPEDDPVISPEPYLDYLMTPEVNSLTQYSLTPTRLTTRAASAGDLVASKTTTPLGNGAYDLQVTLESTSNTASKVDLLIVIDRSCSMKWETGAAGERFRLEAAQEAACSLIDIMNNNNAIDAQYRIVEFSGSGHSPTMDAKVESYTSWKNGPYRVVDYSGWYSNATSAKNRVNAIDVFKRVIFSKWGPEENYGSPLESVTLFNGKDYYSLRATNYEAVFQKITNNSLMSNTGRDDAMKVILFLTDGNPTVAWSTISGTTIDGKSNSEGYGTTYDTTNNVARCLAKVSEEMAALTADRFYALGFGEATTANLETLVGMTSTSKVPFTDVYYSGKEAENLNTHLTGIAHELEQLFCTNVTVTDTLSHNANGALLVDVTDASTIKVTVKKGSTVIGSGSSVSLPATNINSAATVTAKRVNDDLILSFNPATYMLEPGLTYILSATIKPTEAAYREFLNQGESYSGPYADGNNSGFRSNDGAVISYTYGADRYSQSVNDYPVIQLNPGKLVVTKRFTGLTDAEIANLNNLSFAVTLTYPAYGTSISAETVTRNISFSDMTKNADGSYSYEIPNLSPGTTYSVTESGGQVANYNMSTTATGTTGTVTEGATATAAYQNSYVPTTSIKIENQVTGNMGSWEKEFDFTASLSTSMAGLTYIKYNANGQALGSATTITTQTFSFKLRHDEYIVFGKVPIGTSLTISETLNSYDGYTLENVQATNLGNQQLTQSGTSVTLPVSSQASANSYGHIVTFTNDKTVLIETGIALDSLPYVLVLIGVVTAGLFLFLRKPRNYED